MSGRTIVLAALALLAVLGPHAGGSPAIPSAAAGAAQLLPPGSMVDEVRLAGGGFVRGPEIRHEHETLVVASRSGARELRGLSIVEPIVRRTMWLGTDHQGRDLLSLLLHGANTSLRVAFVATLVTLLLGTLAGLVGVLGPPFVGALISALMDALLSLPRLLLILGLGSIFRGSPEHLALAIGLASWAETARLVRAETRVAMGAPYVLAARGFGSGWVRIARDHLTGSLWPVLATAAPLLVAESILLEATLSYLGLGVGPDRPSWGRMIADGQRWIPEGWWIVVFPGLLLLGCALAAHAVASRFRRHLNI